MQQNAPVGKPTAPELGALPIPGIPGTDKTLTKTQKRFNKLIEKLSAQRQELGRWQAFKHVYQQQLAAEYWPLQARARERRSAIARLLDRAMESNAYVKRERAKIRDILLQLLSDLLGEEADVELIELYDKHADVSFGEEQQADLSIMRAVATESFGIDIEEYDGAESPEELSAWLTERVNAAGRQPDQPPRAKQGAKAIAQEALRERAVEGGSRAVREVFRKLVSELHPDRETDPAEQARKTELMQTVNKAYEAGDLLALLEVQLRIEQIDPAALAGLARERMSHYIFVLEEQSRQLGNQVAEIIAPFAIAAGTGSSQSVSPERVQQALVADIRQLKKTLRAVEEDFDSFQDSRLLKRILREYEPGRRGR